MVKVTSIDSEKLIEAVRIWSGWGGVAPNRNDLRLIQRLGEKDANVLLPIIKRLEEDFYDSDACYVASDLEEMGQLAKRHFATMHPDLMSDVGDVFAWCYTFDFK